MTDALSSALQSTPVPGESGEVESVLNPNEQISIFGIALGRCQGSDQGDLQDPGQETYVFDELEN